MVVNGGLLYLSYMNELTATSRFFAVSNNAFFETVTNGCKIQNLQEKKNDCIVSTQEIQVATLLSWMYMFCLQSMWLLFIVSPLEMNLWKPERCLHLLSYLLCLCFGGAVILYQYKHATKQVPGYL